MTSKEKTICSYDNAELMILTPDLRVWNDYYIYVYYY